MTSPTGAFEPCPSCGARRRKSTPGLCGACNRKARNAEYVRKYAARVQAKRVVDRGVQLSELMDPDAIAEAEIEFCIARRRAEIWGHDMTEPEPDDGPGTFISRCRKCEGFLVGDPCETPPFYGRAYDTECAGAPPVRPARRRDPMDEAASTTHRTAEPVGIHGHMNLMAGGKQAWNWDNDSEYLPTTSERMA